jgi:hypothetical protein
MSNSNGANKEQMTALRQYERQKQMQVSGLEGWTMLAFVP